MEKQNRFSSYTNSECTTGDGTLLQFSCHPDEVEDVKSFLSTRVLSVCCPMTGMVHVSHGGYGGYTRYDVIQHKYAGGGGYIEVLEIKDPPEGRCGIIIHEYNCGDERAFSEWETLEQAMETYEKYWGSPISCTKEEFPKLPGFKRYVLCSGLQPWFYAVGNQTLVGDYTFPEELQGDPVYQFGRQFVVMNTYRIPEIKRCMGARVVKTTDCRYPPQESVYRIVYWDDGSCYDESRHAYREIRPLLEGELWIAEAMQRFKQMLAGKRNGFEIKFTDGTKFVGKLANSRSQDLCAEGDYYAIVQIKGREEPYEGWVNEFTPSPEWPDVVQYIAGKYKQAGKEVIQIKITQQKTKKGGKKWTGVFLPPSR